VLPDLGPCEQILLRAGDARRSSLGMILHSRMVIEIHDFAGVAVSICVLQYSPARGVHLLTVTVTICVSQRCRLYSNTLNLTLTLTLTTICVSTL
jgi:hypothetical protein